MMRELTNIAIGFLLLGGVFWVIEMLFPSQAGQPKWRRCNGQLAPSVK